MSFSSSFVAIRSAAARGTIKTIVRSSRFGDAFVAICDEHGTIEVADSEAEANAVIAEALS